MSLPDIFTIEYGYDFRLFINEVLHIRFVKRSFLHLQSYKDDRDSNAPYKIEIHFKEGPMLLLEYRERELWEEILDRLNKIYFKRKFWFLCP